MRLPVICSSLFVLAACVGGNSDNSPVSNVVDPAANPPVDPSAVVRFVGFGDAGQASAMGGAAQKAVGDAMAEVCKERGCDFALEFGDNFYLSGVQSTSDVQWKDKFEDPYANLNLPVFATLGNHDNSRGPGEGSDNMRGEYQVAYHTAKENTSKKWNMPARYYKFTAPLSKANNPFINAPAGYNLSDKAQAPVVEFFSLDSNPLTAIVSDIAPAYNYLTYGPTMLQWYQTGIMNSKAPWKISFGHHPYVSNGIHGNAGSYDQSGSFPPQIVTALPLTVSGKPWLDFHNSSTCAMNVDFYMHGHDHDLEWLKPVDSCNKTTQFILSGTSEQPRAFGDANRNPVYYQRDNVYAFFWFEFTRNKMTGTAYVLDSTTMKLAKDGNGKLVKAFEQSFTK